MQILLDVTRTLTHQNKKTPTGIDRVELAYLRRLLTSGRHDDVGFIVSAAKGGGAIGRRAMRQIFDSIEANWHAEGTPAENSLYEGVRALLENPSPPARGHAARFHVEEPEKVPPVPWLQRKWRNLVRSARRSRIVARSRRKPALYLHTSHMRLENAALFEWTKRGHVYPSFLIHDLIPIDYPQFSGDRAVEMHHRRMRTVAGFASSVIANSAYTGERFSDYFREHGLAAPPVVVSLLGTEIAPPRKDAPRRPKPARPYFISVGTIEGRKNIAGLIEAWRTMLAEEGRERTPLLVLAGKRGWKAQDVFDMLDGDAGLADHLVEVAGVGDAQLAALMEGAVALVQPSFVEGFSLPPAEALCRGVPVIASDIPAHREILGDSALLIDPTDGPGWRQAVLRLAREPDYRQARVEAARTFVPRSWDAHVDAAIEGALEAAREQHKKREG